MLICFIVFRKLSPSNLSELKLGLILVDFFLGINLLAERDLKVGLLTFSRYFS
jgi:hypothetical protein